MPILDVCAFINTIIVQKFGNALIHASGCITIYNKVRTNEQSKVSIRFYRRAIPYAAAST